MEENYLIALLMAVLFGFVLFKKDKETADDVVSQKNKSYGVASGESGVAKYLSQRQAEDTASNISGVAKYLQEKEQLNAELEQSQVLSGVEKYLAEKQENRMSGVSKYMAKQAVLAKQMAKENVSGVEKYLNRRG